MYKPLLVVYKLDICYFFFGNFPFLAAVLFFDFLAFGAYFAARLSRNPSISLSLDCCLDFIRALRDSAQKVENGTLKRNVLIEC